MDPHKYFKQFQPHFPVITEKHPSCRLDRHRSPRQPWPPPPGHELKGPKTPPAIQNSQIPPTVDKMLLVLDSIGHHAHYDLIEGLTSTKIVTKKAYCTLQSGRYPKANYNRVVSDTLKA